jgi:hypothetical protein
LANKSVGEETPQFLKVYLDRPFFNASLLRKTLNLTVLHTYSSSSEASAVFNRSHALLEATSGDMAATSGSPLDWAATRNDSLELDAKRNGSIDLAATRNGSLVDAAATRNGSFIDMAATRNGSLVDVAATGNGSLVDLTATRNETLADVAATRNGSYEDMVAIRNGSLFDAAATRNSSVLDMPTAGNISLTKATVRSGPSAASKVKMSASDSALSANGSEVLAAVYQYGHIYESTGESSINYLILS